MDALFDTVDHGSTWRVLPADVPPWSMVSHHFAAGEAAGGAQQLLDGLRDRVRLAADRLAAPSAAVIDSASVRAAKTVGRVSRGFAAGKGQRRPRHRAVDTVGLLLCVLVTAASVHKTAPAPGPG